MKAEPIFEKLELSVREKSLIEPFFTNVNKSVFAVSFLPPEVIGALCSRTSRAKDDLRLIFLKEFVEPFVKEKSAYGKSLKSLITFLHKNPIEVIFSNPKGREFYIKWLAQYGDDSIAQMAGAHLAYSSLSQIAIKHFEDMRIGLAPIEKSTRYVDYSQKIKGKYRYYVDPKLKELGLEKEYKMAMDGLFEAYTKIVREYFDYLKELYSTENEGVLRAKAFDTARGLLPMATLSQVAFFGNGQAFEYLLARSLDHNLSEVRWASREAFIELSKIIPAFLRRAEGESAQEYRDYLSGKSTRVRKALNSLKWKSSEEKYSRVRLLDYEKDGEDKIVSLLIYPELHEPYESVLLKVKKLSTVKKKKLLDAALSTRKARWYKVPRAFEGANVSFEIMMNIGGWRDLHRHRILTQVKERFNVHNGYDVPKELKEASLDSVFINAIEASERVFKKIEKKDPDIAQYAVSMAHKMRFIQRQNLRSFFWETELRTIPQGHPDYRIVEQEKARLVQKVYPLIGSYLQVDFNSYDFARRGTAEKIKKKEEQLRAMLKKRRGK